MRKLSRYDTTTIEDYVMQFEYVAGMVPELKDKAYLGLFTNGLKDKIKRRIRLHNPPNLGRAIELARDLEAEF